MKRLLSFVFTFTVALALVVVAPPTLASAPTYNSHDRAYARWVVKKLGFTNPAPMSRLLPTLVPEAHLICNALRSGSTRDEVLDVMIYDNGLNERTAIVLMSGAIIFYCPSQ